MLVVSELQDKQGRRSLHGIHAQDGIFLIQMREQHNMPSAE
jgi:hypothetical protein